MTSTICEIETSERAAKGAPRIPNANQLVSIRVSSDVDGSTPQPATFGIPFPIGCLKDERNLSLINSSGVSRPVQAKTLASWRDGSVKWLLIDTLFKNLSTETASWTLVNDEVDATIDAHSELICREAGDDLVVETGKATFVISPKSGSLLKQVTCNGQNSLSDEGLSVVFKDASNLAIPFRIKNAVWESRGPVRATVRVSGEFKGKAPCNLTVRLSFFAGTGLVCAKSTIHNPRRAKHQGGLWDLGDPNSILFTELGFQARPAMPAFVRLNWRLESAQDSEWGSGPVEVLQESSGGKNWQSHNHVDRNGNTPSLFSGYRARMGDQVIHGSRSNPSIAMHSPSGCIAACIEEFWQQFPKAIESDQGKLGISLFPNQQTNPHELQGGEQKTNTTWLNFGSSEEVGLESLEWVNDPVRCTAEPDWYASTGAVPYLIPANAELGPDLERITSSAIDPQSGWLVAREMVDEFGWRNYGDVYADHEEAHYKGTAPLVSHYNNQYDVVLGGLLHYLRTGDKRWWEIADPLARHVIDIDIYHTNEDKSAYNGGLFWHTDHYKSAGSATHRCYAKVNCPEGGAYGGGPCNEHNYSTGLLHYYYLTGDPLAYEAVVSLAQWVINMDDGSQTVFALVDDGPTGAASSTTSRDYHGPGRGVGNSINTLLDGWLLTDDRAYLIKAEELIRRVVHPHDEIEKRDLLNAEMRWSYTVFLSTLARYLGLKSSRDAADASYEYARASLIHYARWMLHHEVPYFDHPEKLEYPTETWAAQELRKANALRFAVSFTEDPTLREQLLERGEELAKRAWSDLFEFERPDTARAIAILLVEGMKDIGLREQPVAAPPIASEKFTFDPPREFVPQRDRVKRMLKSPKGLMRVFSRLANPWRWYKLLSRAPRESQT